MTELLTTAPVALASRATGPRWLAPLLVGTAGPAVSALAIDTPSIWYDEAATISSATRSWSQLAAELGTVDLVHGLYYALLHVWFDLVGYSPLALRLPSAVAIGIAAALVVMLGREVSRERLGVAAGIVFVLLPRTTWAGTEGRSYALTAALAVGTALLLVLAARSGRRRWWIAYGALGVVACVLFVYLALVLAAQLVTLLWLRRRDRRLTRAVATWFVVAAAAGLIVGPFALATFEQRGQVSWLAPIGVDTIPAIVSTQWFFDNPIWTVIGCGALLAGFVAFAIRRQHRWLAAVAIPGLLVPTLALVVVSVLVTPLYTPRYLTMSLPFVALAIGAAIDLLPRRAAIAALALVVAISIPTIVEQRQPTAKEQTDWHTVSQLLADERAADGASSTTAIIFDRVRYHPRATARVIAYAYPDGFADSIDVTLETSAAASGRLWETTNPLDASLGRLTGADTTYLITSIASDGTERTATTLAPLGWRMSESWILSDVRIVRFTRG